jgi:hypothetical protein
MKPKEAPKEIMDIIHSLERKKFYNTNRNDLESKIIAYSRSGEPAFFVRADYKTGKNAPKDPIECWHINNPFTPYFESKRNKIKALQDLIKTQKRLDIDTQHSKTELKEVRTRYNFLIEPRLISPHEMRDRIIDDTLIFIKRT